MASQNISKNSCARRMTGNPPGKSNREVCYKARDSYYKCLLDLGIDIKSSGPVPPQCKALRNTFEKSCLSSWVAHFDAQQEAEARRIRLLHKVIGDKASTLAGGLSGK